MQFTRSLFLRAAACALALSAAGASLAQSYPAKPIRLLVPLAAGSTADILSRTIGNELAREFGQSVVVENKPGAGGTIAMADLARSAPDGHTIAFASQGTLVFNQALYAKPGYDSLKDFALALLLGLIIGTYSSVFTASPLAIALQARAKEPDASSAEAKRRRRQVEPYGGGQKDDSGAVI